MAFEWDECFGDSLGACCTSKLEVSMGNWSMFMEGPLVIFHHLYHSALCPGPRPVLGTILGISASNEWVKMVCNLLRCIGLILRRVGHTGGFLAAHG